jgi:hypothetical protein
MDTKENQYSGPKCKKCLNDDESDYVILLPTFMFTFSELGMVDGILENIAKGLTPIWICPVCRYVRPVTVEDSNSWGFFFADAVLEITNLMNKTKFLESPNFGGKHD